MTPAPLRVALVTTFYPPYSFGGDALAVRALAHALARRGHEVDVIHDLDAFHALRDRRVSEPLDEPPGIRVHRLSSRFGPVSALATQQLGRPLVHGSRIRRILSQGFDVIHFHNISLVGGPRILSYGDGVKLYTAHEHWLVCPTHVLWRHNREVCTGRQCLRCLAHYRRPPQLWRYTGCLARQTRHVDAFLALSESSAQQHAAFGFERPMIVTAPFLGAEAPAERAVPQGAVADGAPPYFLFVGRLEAIKGLQEVIPRFLGDGAAQLWIAGSGAFEPELRRIAAGSPRVRFLGHLAREALPSLYRGAVALVVPSIVLEVFPLVVLEAFREGTPIVARDLGPLPQAVRESGGGLLFRTPQELDEALTMLSTHRARRDELGARAARAFEARWTERAAMAAYFALVRDIAARRGLHDIAARAAAHAS